MYFPILLGTAREGRESEKVSNYMLGVVKEAGHETHLFDPRDHLDSPFTGRAGKEVKGDPEWKESISRANGLIIVSPEYNHGYPGELKLMIDQLYPEYKDLPVVVCGVSNGGFGGARAMEQIFQVIIGIEAIPLKKSLYFPNVADKFDESGKMIDEPTKERASSMIELLAKHARNSS